MTEEQNALRLRDLRILARIIVRAHLSSFAVKKAEEDVLPGDSTGEPAVQTKEWENAA